MNGLWHVGMNVIIVQGGSTIMDRLTKKEWRNLDPWECCGQDYYCKGGCHDEGGCTNGCIVPKLYARLAKYEDTGLMPEQVKALDQENKQKIKNEKRNALQKLVEPLEDFVNTYCCPHDIIIVQQGSIQLFSGLTGMALEILD